MDVNNLRTRLKLNRLKPDLKRLRIIELKEAAKWIPVPQYSTKYQVKAVSVEVTFRILGVIRAIQHRGRNIAVNVYAGGWRLSGNFL